MEGMNVKKVPDIKKDAVTDLVNAKAFVLIAIMEDRTRNHRLIVNVGDAFFMLRELESARMNILFPPQPSAPA